MLDLVERQAIFMNSLKGIHGQSKMYVSLLLLFIASHPFSLGTKFVFWIAVSQELCLHT